MAMEWYFLRVQVGREDRIRDNMILRLKQAGLEDKVPEIIVPKETVADHRGGKRRIQKRKLFPGYLMVQMDLTDDVWFVFRETPGFELHLLVKAVHRVPRVALWCNAAWLDIRPRRKIEVDATRTVPRGLVPFALAGKKYRRFGVDGS